jgi:hypothetical protein
MTYAEQQAAILVHAQAAALAVNAEFTDVKAGVALPSGTRSGRVFYGGECPPPGFTSEPDVLTGKLVGEKTLIAFMWNASDLSNDAYASIDAEMYLVKHELRTRIQGDAKLGGTCVDLDMEYVEPDLVYVGSARWLRLDAEVLTAYVEYDKHA